MRYILFHRKFDNLAGIRKIFTVQCPLIQLSGAMAKKQKIELYLDSQKAVLNSKNPYYDSNTGKAYTTLWHPRHDDLYIVKEGMFGLTDTEKKFIHQLEQLAKDKNIQLKLYDLKNFGHSARAYYKGIEETPVVIIGNKKFTKENLKIEQIIEISKETYESTMDTDRFRNGMLLIVAGSLLGLLAIIFWSTHLCCISALFSAFLIIVGALVSFGRMLDRFFDWAN